MQYFTNRKEYEERGWIEEALLKPIRDVDSEVTIQVTAGQTARDGYPVVKGYCIVLQYSNRPVFELKIFDVGRDDGYYETMRLLVEKYNRRASDVPVHGGRGKASTAIWKMKELACKFAVQYCTDPVELLLITAHEAYVHGVGDGKCQMQESIKKLLNV